jgi:ketosteroid isomerase-like protein
MPDKNWYERLFASIDAKDTPGFLSFLTEDASFRYANAPPAVGQAAIGSAVDQFFAAIRSSSHRLLRRWEEPGSAACQGEVRYVRHDGRSVTLPFCNVFELQGEKIARYEIYIDATPLFAL